MPYLTTDVLSEDHDPSMNPCSLRITREPPIGPRGRVNHQGEPRRNFPHDRFSLTTPLHPITLGLTSHSVSWSPVVPIR
jgi:hypothetical protein